MKFLTALVVLLMSSATVFAQTALDQQIELARLADNLDRQALLLDNVQLTTEEGDAFWPAWKEYRMATHSNGNRMVALLKDFAANYENMDNLKADKLMTDYFSIKMQDLVIKQQFAQKINAFLPAKKVMRITQIENKLDAATHMQLAAEIPLVK
jgi:hypothetical protein